MRKSSEHLNAQEWDKCFENLFLAFKMNEKFLNDAQLGRKIKMIKAKQQFNFKFSSWRYSWDDRFRSLE